VTIESRTWVARKSTRRFGGRFSIAGVELDASQEHSSLHRMSWMPDAKPGRAMICGSNADPVEARLVREVGG
jgi:hypothetical protein